MRCTGGAVLSTGGEPMTVSCRLSRGFWPLLPLLLLLAGCLLIVPSVSAAESPAGKIITDIVPLNNKLRSRENILSIMQSRAGKPYDEGLIQEDVRKLQGTRWFTPGGVQVHTQPDDAGRILVFVVVTEVTNTVQEVVFEGLEHISIGELRSLAGVRKGDPMNPLTNEQGRAAILRKYQDESRYFASVELVEGGKASDTRVVYRAVEGPVVKVGAIEFVGNDHAMAGRLKEQVATKKALLGFIGGKFNPMSLEADRLKIAEYYHGLGYLRVQVFPEVIPAADLHTVRIVYHIIEGEPYLVASRQIDGNKSIGLDKLEALTAMKAGDRYDGRLVREEIKRIEDRYGYEGKSVHVQPALFEVPEEPGKVKVHYQVEGDRGQPDRVGNIFVEGNTVSQDRVILNQLDLRPGQILQYPLIRDAEMRLIRLGIFDAENPPSIEVVQNEFDNMFKDIRVRVNETRTGQFMIGAGVNSNSGVNGSIVLNERNFDLFRFPTSWDDFRDGRAFRGAGQEFRLEAVPATIFQRYSATWREPYLFDSRFGLTNSAYYFTRNYVEYTENRVGFRTTVDRRLDQFWRTNLGVRIEGMDVNNVPDYAPPSISDDIGQSTVLGMRLGVTRDSRDSFLYPTHGSVFDAGVEQVLGDYTFPVGTVEYTKFLSTQYLQREDGSGKHVIALRSQLSVAGNDAPVFERFYAGGFRSIRGFSFRGVGPNENGFFTGGKFSFLNTVEYQIPILPSDKLYFVSFVDHGTVETNVDIKNYRVAAGFGFRVAVPMLGPAPLAFDFAFPITKAPWDNQQIFSFYVGLFGGS